MTGSVDIGDDDPVTLDEACRLFFRGILTKSALRTEARRGNLEIIRIANKDFVTHSGVKRMIEKCHKSENRQGSISGRTLTPNPAAQPQPGSFGTVQPMSAQDALRERLNRPKPNSANISQKKSSHNGAVLQLPQR